MKQPTFNAYTEEVITMPLFETVSTIPNIGFSSIRFFASPNTQVKIRGNVRVPLPLPNSFKVTSIGCFLEGKHRRLVKDIGVFRFYLGDKLYIEESLDSINHTWYGDPDTLVTILQGQPFAASIDFQDSIWLPNSITATIIIKGKLNRGIQ